MRLHRRARRLTATATTASVAVVVTVAGLLVAVPADARTPAGGIDSVVRQGYGVEVRGFAADPDTSAPATVNVSVDGVRKATTTAGLPHGTTNTGYDVAVRGVGDGTHGVCVSADDYPATKAVLLGCRSITLDYDPTGRLGAVTQSPGALTVTGWALDRDYPLQKTSVTVRMDNRTVVSSATADQPLAGLSKWYPVAGDDHGFSATFPATEGVHTVCVTVHNLGQGHDAALPCTNPITVSFSPRGAISGLSQTPGGIAVAGWAVDPDTTAPTSVTVTSDGATLGTVPAKIGVSRHAFHAVFPLGTRFLKPGARTVCVTAHNLGAYGSDKQVDCWTRTFNWNPSGGLDSLAQHAPGGGALVTGWATDPDTTDPILVRITDGTTGATLTTVTANAAGSHAGHSFRVAVPVTDGTHTLCVTAINTHWGTADSAPSCGSAAFRFEPYGSYESVARDPSTGGALVTGWAIDPDTSYPISIRASVDGGPATIASGNLQRLDVAKNHPGMGYDHGFSIVVPAADGEHKVCVSAVNTAGGTANTVLGCKLLIAVHPTAPSAPTAVKAVGGYGGAQIAWTAPTSDGGAPWTGYTVRALPNGPSMTVGPTTTSATLLGLAPGTKYSFSVVANNVAGSSAPGASSVVTTEKEPPAQTSPAPISTSRYIRNVRGASSTDLAMMKAEGAADAKRNPSGHGYLIVLAVGGQDESRQGVILTAGIRYVSYANMVADLKAYVDGYASQQKASAPVTLALATNNDIDVYRSSGASFADKIVDPVAAYAAKYPGITIAGSDDMEPGFSASYSQTKSWLQGYLAATKAPFVFTGSADGCAWTYTNGSCNNGWTAAGMYYLSGGANPIGMISMPQIYNSVMAQQWRYISLTGVGYGQPKINFGGALTEYTACAQAGSCGSLTAPTAWNYLWQQLRSDSRLMPKSLPYSTDLRIDS